MPKDIGKEIVANMVALGAIGRISQAVSVENLEAALVARAGDPAPLLESEEMKEQQD